MLRNAIRSSDRSGCWIPWILLSLSALLLPGCATDLQTHLPSRPESATRPTLTTEMNPCESVALRPGMAVDILVMVAGAKEIDERSKRISQDDQLILPFLGSVSVKDMSIQDLRNFLLQRYGTLFIDPAVEVGFSEGMAENDTFPWGYVTIWGRVKKPGRVPIPATGDLTLTMAVQHAGGFDIGAKVNDVIITRQGGDGMKTFSANLAAVRNFDTSQDHRLQAGDVIVVPERFF